MSITIVTPENVDAYGRFTVVTRQLAEVTDIDPLTGLPYTTTSVISVHRAPLAPGAWDDKGNWLATDLSGQPAMIQAFATDLWSASVVAAFKAAFPWAPD